MEGTRQGRSGATFQPGRSDPRPDHFFLFTKQGWMQPALTGGAVNVSGGIIITERDRIFYIDPIFETA